MVGFLCPVKPTKRTLPCLLGCSQRLQHAIRLVGLLRIVVVDHLVNLPNVQVIRLKPGKRLLQHLHRYVLLPAVRAHLGHHDRLVALSFERCAHPFLAHALVILPGVIEEVDAVVHGLGNHVVDDLLTRSCSQVVSTHPQDRDLEPGAAHGALGYGKGTRARTAGLAFGVGNDRIRQLGKRTLSSSSRMRRLRGSGLRHCQATHWCNHGGS